MTQKEKAKQLVEKMIIYHSPDESDYEAAKQCALIAVDEIMNYMTPQTDSKEAFDYWREVKQEIEKL
jgi:2-hydroxy-3-keto-5-methylthiopentenyl-1-phosphate phosphatase